MGDTSVNGTNFRPLQSLGTQPGGAGNAGTANNIQGLSGNNGTANGTPGLPGAKGTQPPGAPNALTDTMTTQMMEAMSGMMTAMKDILDKIKEIMEGKGPNATGANSDKMAKAGSPGGSSGSCPPGSNCAEGGGASGGSNGGGNTGGGSGSSPLQSPNRGSSGGPTANNTQNNRLRDFPTLQRFPALTQIKKDLGIDDLGEPVEDKETGLLTFENGVQIQPNDPKDPSKGYQVSVPTKNDGKSSDPNQPGGGSGSSSTAAGAKTIYAVGGDGKVSPPVLQRPLPQPTATPKV
ncbi:MAG: hypothetical protein K2X66_08520 [Cyanobacteria bacterium]|nr:hypothetical protein [Cyanobacteriota bacterium]